MWKVHTHAPIWESTGASSHKGNWVSKQITNWISFPSSTTSNCVHVHGREVNEQQCRTPFSFPLVKSETPLEKYVDIGITLWLPLLHTSWFQKFWQCRAKLWGTISHRHFLRVSERYMSTTEKCNGRVIIFHGKSILAVSLLHGRKDTGQNNNQHNEPIGFLSCQFVKQIGARLAYYVEFIHR